MAVSSLLSPEKIARSPRGTVQDAQNFISGGSPIGSSVVQSAANKIVGFQRAEVKPVTPDINSIISSITNNVLSSVDNSIKSATQIINNDVDNKITNVTERLSNEIQTVRSSGPVTQLQNIVQVVQNKINQSIQKVIGDFSNDYAQKIRNIEENKPSQVLDKFLKVYRNALEFIQFFGNQKNIDRLKSNLVALKTSFNESFEVAKLVRQVIVKIVNQLSNLPRATPSGGGLNLDVNVPGSPLKKAGAPAMKGMGRGKMLGLGALGLGAAGLGGGAVVNALADSEQVQPQQVQADIPQNLVDRFGAVVDRFSNILDALVGKKKEENITVTSSGGTSSGEPKTKPGTGGGGPTPPPTGEISGSQQQIESQMFDYLKKNYGENVAYGMLSNAMRESGYRTNAPEGGYFGMFQLDKNREVRFKEWAKSKNLDPMSRQAQLQYGVIEAQQLGTLERMKAAKTPEDAASLFYNEFERAAYSKPIVGSRYTPNNPHEIKNRQFLQDIRKRQESRVKSSTDQKQIPAQLPSAKVEPSSTKSQVSAAPTQTQVAQQRAASVSQPPPTQVASSVSVVPIDLSSTQQQSGGGGGQVVSTPPSQKNGPSIPMLPSSNPDNFLVLYSKIVYNVVDG